MKLSEKKRTELYKAISEPIFQTRIGISRMGPGDKKLEQVDEKLFKLEQEIWKEVTKALGIQRP
jgi:hypothetical protein